MPANSRWDLIRRLRVNEGSGKFVSLWQVLTEPAIPSSLTTNFQFVMPATIGKGLLYP